MALSFQDHNFDIQTKVKHPLQNFILYRLRYPLFWMFCTQESNHTLNQMYERAFRINSENYTSRFSDLVPIFNENTIHQRF